MIDIVMLAVYLISSIALFHIFFNSYSKDVEDVTMADLIMIATVSFIPVVNSFILLFVFLLVKNKWSK